MSDCKECGRELLGSSEQDLGVCNACEGGNTPKTVEEILTKLENDVAHDVTQRVLHHKSGRSPKSSHLEAITALNELRKADAEAIIGEYEKVGLPTTQAQEQSNYDKRIRNAMRDWQRETAGLPTRYDTKLRAEERLQK